MKDICNLINTILQDKEIFGQNTSKYSYSKIRITSKDFSDKLEAAKEFFSLKDGNGWICDTSTNEIKMFSQNDEVKLEELGWIIEGESVSQDGKISNRISQNYTGGWKVQCFENTDEDSANKAITCNVQLRQIRGNHITYQIGYCLDGDGKLCPEWQRLLKITLD